VVLSTKSSVKHGVAFVAIILCFLSAACSEGKTAMDTVALDVKTLPLMHSEDVSTLISDSGITRYRMVAKVWDVYDNPQPQKSYWYFPKGIYVEKFDSLFNVEGSIESDTAYNYDKKQLWHLIGNVKAMNLKKDKFETQEMFWDERLHKIYSDQPIRIEQIDGRVILGIGFDSNESMTDRHIYNVYADFYVSEKDSIP